MAWKKHFSMSILVDFTVILRYITVPFVCKSVSKWQNPNLGGLLGSTFGLLVGIGFGRGHIFPLIWTQMKV